MADSKPRVQSAAQRQPAPKPTPKPAAPSGPPMQKEVFKGHQEIVHRLFKLNVAQLNKNHGTKDDPKWSKWEHTHAYHSVDSKGRPQNQCSPIGGHFHKIEIIDNGEGNAPSLKIGPALRMVGIRRNRRIVREAYPIDNDTHTHTGTYVHSEILVPKRINPEFAKLQGTMAARERGDIPLKQKTFDDARPQ